MVVSYLPIKNGVSKVAKNSWSLSCGYYQITYGRRFGKIIFCFVYYFTCSFGASVTEYLKF